MKRYFEFIWHRALAEIQADISRVMLGILWWILEPLLYLLAFYVIFGIVFQQRGENYVSFLLTGLVVWKWFASTINNAMTSIARNMTLIYQVYLPKLAFPMISMIICGFRFAIVFMILLFFLTVTGGVVTSAWLIDLPLLLLLQVFFMLGVAMTLAAIGPFVPDIKRIVENGMLLLFFLSGIFFRFDAIPDSLRPYFDFNPMAVLIHNYREVLLEGRHVDWGSFWPIGILTFFFLGVGTLLLVKLDRAYAKRAFL